MVRENGERTDPLHARLKAYHDIALKDLFLCVLPV